MGERIPKLSAEVHAPGWQEYRDWGKLKVPKLEPQIKFLVGTFSHELAKHLEFTVHRSCANLPRTPPRPFHQLLLLLRRSRSIGPAQSLLTARESHVLHLLACAGGWQSTSQPPVERLLREHLVGSGRGAATSGAAASGAHKAAARQRGTFTNLKSYFLVGRLVLVTRFRSGNTTGLLGLNDLLPGTPARSFAGFELSSRDLA